MIDTHAHLTDERYGGGKNELARAFSAGVKNVIVVGYDLASSQRSLEFANSNDGVFCAAGVHPSDCETLDNGVIAALSEILKQEKCVALGEIGIDKHYGADDADVQKGAFEKQILLAERAGLPFIVHSREATKEVIDVLKANKSHLTNGFLMHCYSESKESAKIYLDLGAYFAFGGVITFKNAKKDEIIKSLPIDRIMFETDCPYMAPVPHRGETNEPAFVKYVYEKAAEIMGVSFEKLCEIAADNAQRLFKKADFSSKYNQTLKQ